MKEKLYIFDVVYKLQEILTTKQHENHEKNLPFYS